MKWKYTFTPEQIAEIETARKTVTDKRIGRYLEALYLRVQGESYKEMIQRTGLSSSTITLLVQIYAKDGLEAIIKRNASKKRGIKFTQEQITEIEEAYRAITDKKVAHPLEVLYLRAHGKTYKEIIKKTGFANSTIALLMQIYEKDGLEAIVKRHSTPLSTPKNTTLKLTPEQFAELRNVLGTTDSERVARRIKALLLRAEGKTYVEIVEKTGFNPLSVRRIIREYQANGLENLRINRRQ